MTAPTYLDCCERPELSVLRLLYQSTHDLESLKRCDSCGTYWFYRFHEWTNWATGDDDLTAWHAPLTDDEGARLRDAPDRESMDLSFLEARRSWMSDDEGARRVSGTPGHPWS